VTIDDYYDIDITKKYSVDFSNYESGILRISGDQFVGVEELVLVLSYNTSGVVGKFQIKANIDNIPNGYTGLSGTSIGAFNKILKLEPISNSSVYYVLIEGEKGTKFFLYFEQTYPSSPTLEFNSSLVYSTNDNLTYYAHGKFENVELPLYIRLDSCSGYGVFEVSYCGGLLNATFQNINGENG
jgi:hypothetical protein